MFECVAQKTEQGLNQSQGQADPGLACHSMCLGLSLNVPLPTKLGPCFSSLIKTQSLGCVSLLHHEPVWFTQARTDLFFKICHPHCVNLTWTTTVFPKLLFSEQSRWGMSHTTYIKEEHRNLVVNHSWWLTKVVLGNSCGLNFHIKISSNEEKSSNLEDSWSIPMQNGTYQFKCHQSHHWIKNHRSHMSGMGPSG